MLFNSLTGCGLCASSDAVAQYLEEHDKVSTSFRIRRILSAGCMGAFFGGWVYPQAYARLDRIWKGTNVSAVLQKSVVEIATVGIFVNSVSMTARGLLVGRDMKDVAEHVVTEMPVVTLNDARVWLPYNIIAFTFIPATIRPTTTLCMEAVWQTYISLMANNYYKIKSSESSLHKNAAQDALTQQQIPKAIIATSTSNTTACFRPHDKS